MCEFACSYKEIRTFFRYTFLTVVHVSPFSCLWNFGISPRKLLLDMPPEKTWRKHWLEISPGCRISSQTFPSKHMSGGRNKPTPDLLFFLSQLEEMSNCSEHQKSKYPQDLLNWVLSSCRIADKCSSALGISRILNSSAKRTTFREYLKITPRESEYQKEKPWVVQAKSCFNLAFHHWKTIIYCMLGQASGYRLNPWSPSGTIRNFEPGISLEHSWHSCEHGVKFHGRTGQMIQAIRA